MSQVVKSNFWDASFFSTLVNSRLRLLISIGVPTMDGKTRPNSCQRLPAVAFIASTVKEESGDICINSMGDSLGMYGNVGITESDIPHSLLAPYGGEPGR